ncbi:MAG: hypothetical protein KKA44_01890, partial [Alphaproteobacteria bacterium]|nr:hypothetical protein [Alphaproteobacteria bacterium]
LSANDIDAIIAKHNNTPRKCLGFKTPAETFIPLHFKCESTPGSSPGWRSREMAAPTHNRRFHTIRLASTRYNAPSLTRGKQGAG